MIVDGIETKDECNNKHTPNNNKISNYPIRSESSIKIKTHQREKEWAIQSCTMPVELKEQ